MRADNLAGTWSGRAELVLVGGIPEARKQRLMEDSNGRVELALALKTLREGVRGLVGDQVIVERANAILYEDARLRHARAERAARDRGVKPLPFSESEKVASRGAFNSWMNAHPKLPPTEKQLLAVVTAIHRVQTSRDDAQLSTAASQHWSQLYRAAATTPSRTVDRNPVPNPDNESEPERLGRQLSQFDNPLELDVHEPITVTVASGLPVLPPYVRRGHDDDLTAVVERALAGHSGIAVLLGDSSTGKTRALWEALAPLREHDGWRLWHPSPSRQEELSDQLDRVEPRTVLWLNETQRYFLPASQRDRDRLAEDLNKLIADTRRRPVLIVGTLWHIHYNTLCTDPGTAARKLFGPAVITVPPKFTGHDLDAMRTAARGDARLELACARAEGGQITQYLAGGPELVHFYDTAGETQKAVIDAAMDAVRLGHPNVLAFTMLRDVAAAYVSDTTWDCLPDDWFETALAETSRSCKGARGPITLLRSRPVGAHGRGRRSRVDAGSGEPVYQLADYLDQHGRTRRADIVPPNDFWSAVVQHVDNPSAVAELGRAAHCRGLYRWSAQLWKKAGEHGHVTAAIDLLRHLHDVDPSDSRPAEWALRNLQSGECMADLLSGLREIDAHDQVKLLLARDPAEQVDMNDPGCVAKLLKELGRAGAHTQVMALLARNPAETVAVSDRMGVARLLSQLQRAGAHDQKVVLLTRYGSDPLAALTPFSDLFGESVKTAYNQANADEVPLTVTMAVAIRLAESRMSGAHGYMKALLARNPAEHVELTDPTAVAILLNVLARFDGPQLKVLLARNPAECVSIRCSVAPFVKALRKVGAYDQIEILLARNPAEHIELFDPGSVAELLEQLWQIGSHCQVEVLLARNPARQLSIGGTRVEPLVEVLERIGATSQLAILVERLSAAGRFKVFMEIGDHGERFRFGREPDGTASAVWTWDDLA